MKDFKDEIAKQLAKILNLEQEEIKNMIEIPKAEIMGDYAFPCFRLAKTFAKAPNLIAEELKEKLELARNRY